MSVLVISDVHIGWSKANVEQLKTFLRQEVAKPDVTELVIAGDLIELWRKGYVPVMLKHAETWDAIKQVQQSGTEVTLLVGNHDRRLIRSSPTGNVQREEPWTAKEKHIIEQGGNKFTIVHGHKADPGNWNDVRNEALCASSDEVGYAMSEGFENAIEGIGGAPSSVTPSLESRPSALRHLSNPDVLAKDTNSRYVDKINERLKKRHSGTTVAGHTHVPVEEEGYINCGSWTGPKNTYCRISEGSATLEQYTPE